MRKSGILGLFGVASIALSGCATVAATPDVAADEPEEVQASTGVGTYLAANFAASAGDIASAAGFYNEMLRIEPNNVDVLVRSFLYSAAAGDMARAVPL